VWSDKSIFKRIIKPGRIEVDIRTNLILDKDGKTKNLFSS
jgi:hypothetical protein